jgi:hypothetical protein
MRELLLYPEAWPTEMQMTLTVEESRPNDAYMYVQYILNIHAIVKVQYCASRGALGHGPWYPGAGRLYH